MGNQMSVPERAEEQESELETNAYKASDSRGDQNGMPVIVSTHTVQHYDQVDLGISIPKENAATSSPETMAEANGKNLGKEAKPEAAAAKSRFFLTLSRPVPGRAGDQGVDSSSGPAKLVASTKDAAGNKGPSEESALAGAAAPGPAAHKTPGRTPGPDPALPAPGTPEPGAAPARDAGFFDRFFKLDKGRDRAAADSQEEEGRSAERGDPAEEAPGCAGQGDAGPAGQDIVDGKGQEEQETKTLNCSVSGDPEGQEIAEEDSQTTNPTENNSIMSFFKTLVSPNKAETKEDPADTASKAESVCDGQAGQKTSETQAKGSRKKRLDSPRLGPAVRRFFGHKGAEKSPNASANLKSDKANFTPQEAPGAAKSPKACTSPGPLPSVVAETAKEDGKEKSGPTSLPLGKLFWKKSVKEDSVPTGAEENVVCESPVEITKLETVESATQTEDPREEDVKPEPSEVKLQREESKPRRTSLLALLRQMSVRGNEGIMPVEDVNGKDSDCQTSNSAEKTATPPEPEPTRAAQKGKEASSKDKRLGAETNKRKSSKPEAKEPAPCTEPATGDVNALQNGGKSQKRPEKPRQSLGGFLKGLGPKRMSDAQVQTDPVSIGPAGKSK